MTRRGTRTHQGMRMAMDSGIKAGRTPGLLPYRYVRSIPCPDCPAVEGEACVSKNGKGLAQAHISRRRLAIRKYRAEQGEG